MRRPGGVLVGVASAVLLAGCGGAAGAEGGPRPTSTVTVTAAAVTATAPAVEATPPAVTVPGPTVTRTAEPATVTAEPVTETAEPVTVTVTGAGPGATPGDAAGAGSDALAALESLPVRERASKAGYDRSEFGSEWTDAVRVNGGRNGCDTRNDILRRDLRELVVTEGTQGCVAQTGVLDDLYTGEALPFERGTDSGSQIHIDHIVSLSNAWQTGAQDLSVEQRTDLANDPLNLLATAGRANQQKSDGDAATWLPPNRGARCPMVAHQVAVKVKYGLWVTPPEADAARRVLGDCPGQALPTDATAQIPAPR